MRGRGQRALAVLVGSAICIVIYLGVVVLVALMSPQRVFAVGEDHCFDDWCVAVKEFTVVPELGEGGRCRQGEWAVLRRHPSTLQSCARTVAARSSVAVRLIDGHGRTYEVSPQGQAAFEARHGPAPPLTSTLELGQFLDTVRVFDLPTDAHDVGLTVEHPVGPAPGLFIIGDDASLLHEPAIVRLD